MYALMKIVPFEVLWLLVSGRVIPSDLGVVALGGRKPRYGRVCDSEPGR